MAILDLQDMEMPETVAFGSNKSNNRCTGGGNGGGGGSHLSVTLC
jgi:hypothetical protein